MSAGYTSQDTEVTATAETRTRWTWIGVSYAVSPQVGITGAFYKTKISGAASGDKDNFMLAATYALSKRTNLYAGYDNAKYDGAARAAAFGNTSGLGRQRGISLGVNPFF